MLLSLLSHLVPSWLRAAWLLLVGRTMAEAAWAEIADAAEGFLALTPERLLALAERARLAELCLHHGVWLTACRHAGHACRYDKPPPGWGRARRCDLSDADPLILFQRLTLLLDQFGRADLIARRQALRLKRLLAAAPEALVALRGGWPTLADVFAPAIDPARALELSG